MHFFLLLPVLLVSYPRIHCQIQCEKDFPLCFLPLICIDLALIVRFFALIFFIWYKVRVQRYYFEFWISNLPSTIFWKDWPLPSEWPWYTYHLTIYAKVYFWAFYFIALVYMSVLMPLPHTFDNFSFVVSSKIRKCKSFRKSYFNSHKIKIKIWISLSLVKAEEVVNRPVWRPKLLLALSKLQSSSQASAYHTSIF